MLRVLTSNVFASFCKLKLDKTAVAAIWAEAVYNKIRLVHSVPPTNNTLMEDIKELKLADSVKNNLEELADETEIAAGRSEIMEIFDPFKGAHLPPSVLATQ